MKATGLNAFMARVDAAEYGLCRRLNRGAALPLPRRIFQVASRLGRRRRLVRAAARAAAAVRRERRAPAARHGAHRCPGGALYALLKRVFVRERPFITHTGIDRAASPLDRYSFPSGHTLHAVSFTWQCAAHFPELLLVLVPLAALIAASRVVLGLHYPSDVLAGAALGAALAALGVALH